MKNITECPLDHLVMPRAGWQHAPLWQIALRLLCMLLLAALTAPNCIAQESAVVPTLEVTRPATVDTPDMAAPINAETSVKASTPSAESSPTIATPNATPPSAPQLVGVNNINAGDTAWMLMSSALVLLMTLPGLMLFYGGMVRKKNVLGTMAQSIILAAAITVLWYVIGYSLAFTPGTALLGGLERCFLEGVAFFKDKQLVSVSHIAPTIPETVFVMFQLTFAIITPALVTGAFAERMKFSAMAIFLILWTLMVYCPVAHWVWEPGGWLAARGTLDFAGGTVVHINAGITGLICAVVLGKRAGYGSTPLVPHNLTLTMLGAALLWVGWFGFNAGSAVAADGRAGMAMLVTQIGAACGVLGWVGMEMLFRQRVTTLGLASGAVAGLVGITPAAGFVNPTGALWIGLCAGAFSYFGATSLKVWLRQDDSLDVFGVHGIAGITGALLTGVFNDPIISGVRGDLATQFTGVIATLLYAGIVSYVLLKILDALMGLRISPEAESKGLDVALHGEHIE